MAILLIAIHTALYVFRKGNGNGLYLYRAVAFAAFAGIPLLLSSLAFINRPAFVNSGEYCYLPIKPGWTRKSLTWVPRYIILAIIVVIYSGIYVYIATLMKKFRATSTGRRESSRSSEVRSDQRKKMASVPPLPQIQRHGLIPSPDPSSRDLTFGDQRRSSVFSAIAESVSRHASSA